MPNQFQPRDVNVLALSNVNTNLYLGTKWLCYFNLITPSLNRIIESFLLLSERTDLWKWARLPISITMTSWWVFGGVLHTVINRLLCDNSLYSTLLFNSHWTSVNVSSAFCRHPQFDNHTWTVYQNLASCLPRQHLGFTLTGIFELSATVLLSWTTSFFNLLSACVLGHIYI